VRLRLLAICVLTAFAVSTACSFPGTKVASSTRTVVPPKSPVTGDKLDPQVAAPAGFPADVPVYTGARLTAAAAFTSPGQVAWGMEWQTLDGIDKVQAFYKTRLSQGDWQISFNGTANQAFSANYSRKSNPKVAGLLGADGSSGLTRITLSLLVPT
jgi:hypothetical protein